MGVINQLLTLFLWTFSFLGLFLADAALPLCDIPIDQLSRAQMPHPTTNQHLVVLFCYVFNLENKLNILCSNQLHLTCLFLFHICMNPPCLTLQAPFSAITTINQWQFLDDIAMLKSSVTSPSGGCVEPWAPGRGVVTWQLFESVNSWGIRYQEKLDGSRLWFFHVAHVNCEDEDSNHSIEIAVWLFHIAMV